jgi:radical SAM protein with 4Fe4S-binding SPASM domain
LDAETRGCLAGSSVCFVSHRGEVFPCGYLPVRAGSVREQPLNEIWEGSPVFAAFRGGMKLEGKCGLCEYRVVCGGCRARAFGTCGSVWGADPYCAYEPARKVSEG